MPKLNMKNSKAIFNVLSKVASDIMKNPALLMKKENIQFLKGAIMLGFSALGEELENNPSLYAHHQNLRREIDDLFKMLDDPSNYNNAKLDPKLMAILQLFSIIFNMMGLGASKSAGASDSWADFARMQDSPSKDGPLYNYTLASAANNEWSAQTKLPNNILDRSFLTNEESAHLDNFIKTSNPLGLGANPQWMIERSTKNWLNNTDVGKNSAPGKAITASQKTIDRTALTDLERKDLDYHIQEATSNLPTTYQEEYTWDRYSTEFYTEEELQANKERAVQEAEQQWLKSPIGENSGPGQEAAKNNLEMQKHWKKSSGEAHSSTPTKSEGLSVPIAGSIPLNDFTPLERKDFESKLPSIIKPENTEALREKLGNEKYSNASFSFDNKTHNTYSSRAEAKKSVTDQELNDYRTKTIKAAEQEWLKTPVGQHSKHGIYNTHEQQAAATNDNVMPTMSPAPNAKNHVMLSSIDSSKQEQAGESKTLEDSAELKTGPNSR